MNLAVLHLNYVLVERLSNASDIVTCPEFNNFVKSVPQLYNVNSTLIETYWAVTDPVIPPQLVFMNTIYSLESPGKLVS